MDEEKTPAEEKRKPIDIHYVNLLKSKGWTDQQIAEKLGTTYKYIHKIRYEDRKRKAMEEETKRPRGRPKGSKNKRTIAEEKALTNWTHSAVAPLMREDKADLNRMAGWFVTECLKQGQMTDKDDIDSLYASLQKYIELCTTSGMPMLVKTCQLALGVNPKTFAGWKNGTSRSDDPRYKSFAELVYAVVGAGLEASSAAGAIDRVLCIWWEKSHFNMIEGDGRERKNEDPLGERKSANEIAEKYSDLPD